jgi:hypothetical protein
MAIRISLKLNHGQKHSLQKEAFSPHSQAPRARARVGKAGTATGPETSRWHATRRRRIRSGHVSVGCSCKMPIVCTCFRATAAKTCVSLICPNAASASRDDRRHGVSSFACAHAQYVYRLFVSVNMKWQFHLELCCGYSVA